MKEKFEYNLPIRMTVQSHHKILVVYHWHKNFEFIKVLSGKVLVRLDGHNFIGHKNDIIFVPCKKLHGIESLDDDAAILGIVVERKYISSLLEAYETKRQVDYLLDNKQVDHVYDMNHELWHKVNQSVENMYKIYMEKDLLYELALKEQLFKVMREIFLYHHKSLSVDRLSGEELLLIEPAINYMMLHYQEKITVENLSQAVNMSSSHFSRLFKKVTDQTPMNYLLDIRMKEAMKLLRDSHESITSVAFDCGFKSIGYFTKTFTAYVGVPPRAYRKQVT
ncbi:helix-turn-helix domain-containing protein [Acidaminobacter sp. JC074]|uniref:AraC family transcriptional regulator n=1 Tax=Acidaminobacter sp. JC074 TaxID=2530199 RepID=UPI001F0D0265|nr:AraC family transcriptional regulator [Acidaminobacter sp. JC074]MCH4886992.1 helix-turn-helix domain-containing protein [Acidaminobacter sp. JC074]